MAASPSWGPTEPSALQASTLGLPGWPFLSSDDSLGSPLARGWNPLQMLPLAPDGWVLGLSLSVRPCPSPVWPLSQPLQAAPRSWSARERRGGWGGARAQ